jgi:hypothetical protein
VNSGGGTVTFPSLLCASLSIPLAANTANAINNSAFSLWKPTISIAVEFADEVNFADFTNAADNGCTYTPFTHTVFAAFSAEILCTAYTHRRSGNFPPPGRKSFVGSATATLMTYRIGTVLSTTLRKAAIRLTITICNFV